VTSQFSDDEWPDETGPAQLELVRDEPPRNGRGSLASRLLGRTALGDLPKPEPLIEGTIDRRTVALLAGAWGSGKSFIAQDWAACTATGRRWQGRNVAAGPVRYVAAEGAYGLSVRFDAWEYAWGRKIDNDAFAVLPIPVNLLNRADVAELCSLVEGCALVVIDTMARCLIGADENSAKDMGMAVDSLYTIREATGDGTVLAVHHTGKDRSTIRGSSALEAGVDTIYTTEGDARLIQLTRTKRKDGPLEDRMQLKLDPALESVVVVSARGADMTQAADTLMSAFVSAFGDGTATKTELRGVADMAPASFHRGLTFLVKHGLLVNQGTEPRPIYRKGEEA